MSCLHLSSVNRTLVLDIMKQYVGDLFVYSDLASVKNDNYSYYVDARLLPYTSCVLVIYLKQLASHSRYIYMNKIKSTKLFYLLISLKTTTTLLLSVITRFVYKKNSKIENKRLAVLSSFRSDCLLQILYHT